MIDWFERAEAELEYLLETDRQVAELRVKWERDKRKAKRKWSAIYLRSAGNNIEEKKAQTELHPEYESAVAAEMTSLLEYEAARNKRDTAKLVIEFWRSWQKAVREGQP